MPDLDLPALNLSVPRRLAVLGIIIAASTTHGAATFTATAILPQVQGALAATPDEIAWTVTFNILAVAIALPLSGWLVGRFGRRTVLVGSLAGFTFATLLCGLAQSLESLVLWRCAQGAVGAALMPLGQIIILDIFPRRQHAMVISLFGLANTAGPVLGPLLGSYLAVHYSWRWAFHMLVPIGALSAVLAMLALPRDAPERSIPLDWIGFLSLSTTVACLQLVLSRGQRLDWFQSQEIVIEAALAALGFYIFIVHSLTAKQPFIDLRMLFDRNYAVGLLLVTLFGMITFTPMVVLPSLLQNQMGFGDADVGAVISWRGLGVTAGFLASLALSRADPRAMIALGFIMQVWSGLWMLSLDLNADVTVYAVNAFLQGTSVGLVWSPISTTTFWTLAPVMRAEAMALFHLVRSVGTSFFIAISVAEVVASTGANYSRISEAASIYNRVLALPWAAGGWSIDTLPGLAALSHEINRQAAMLGYLNSFVIYTVVAAAAIPLTLLIGRLKRTG